MSVARLEFVLRVLGGILAGAAGWYIGRGQLDNLPSAVSSSSHLVDALIVVLAFACFAAAFALTPLLTTRPFFWLLQKVISTPIGDICAAAGGLFGGLLLGALLAWPLSLLPFFGGFLPIVASLVLGYLGMTTVMSHKREVFQLFTAPRELFRSRAQQGEAARALVDTSAIIDGRLADVAATGFLPSALLVPRFVLHELQNIADSPDSLRRNRGRRGLDMLDRLRNQPRVTLEVVEDGGGGGEVDAELVQLARALRCSIITTDYNLNRVATLQGVTVLNVNELANAVKSIVLPAEELSLRILQEGKEYGQGVGYLADGTMVVVENGRRYIDAEVEVVVLRVLQTAAGRLVFAQLKAEHSGRAAS